MTISKRLRFEILRRDDFRCTYCGATPAEAELNIDHVVPVTLGGSDIPENLTTACAPCNSGKSSTSPTEEVVAAVNLAVAAQAAASLATRDRAAEFADEFNAFDTEVEELWWSFVDDHVWDETDRPDVSMVANWFSAEVPIGLIEFAFRLANEAGHIPPRSKAAYAIAVVRNKMQQFAEEVAGGTDPFDQTRGADL